MSENIICPCVLIAELEAELTSAQAEIAELRQRTWDNDAVSKRIDEAQRAAYERAVEIVEEVDSREWFKNQSLTCIAIANAIRKEMAQ